MTKSDLQRARLDLLIAYCGAVVQAEIKSELDFGANLEYHRESMKDVFAPAFEYLETLEADARAIENMGKIARLPPSTIGEAVGSDGIEFTASLAPHFKKELSRVCVETGKPLPEWATGTTIDYDGRVFAWEDTPLYYEESGSGEWLLVGGQYGYLGKKPQVYGPDARATWREYPKADK